MRASLVTRLLLALTIAGLLLAGCGDDDDSGDTTTTTSEATTTTTAGSTTTGIGGGSAECTEEALLEVLQGAPDVPAYVSIDSYQCADGWAVVFADVGPSEAEAVTVTEVFEAEGPFWVPQDREQVCPEPSPVPTAIYQQACETN